MENFYQQHARGRKSQDDEVHIISFRGISFKRYLELGKLLNILVAAIRDNDGDYRQNCVVNYADETYLQACIFADHDPARSTLACTTTTRKPVTTFWARPAGASRFGLHAQEQSGSFVRASDSESSAPGNPSLHPRGDRMGKSVMFAVAGSGKTTLTINRLGLEQRALIITYTEIALRIVPSR